MRNLSLLLLGSVIAFTTPLKAQVFDMGGLTATLAIDHVTQVERKRANGASELSIQDGLANNITNQLVAPSSKSFSTSDTRYDYSKSRTRMNLAQFVEKAKLKDPQGAAKMAEVFAGSDVIADIGKGISQYGLRTDRVADAYTLYWINAWQAANGQYGDPPNQQIAKVKQQSANALLSTPEFVNSTDAIKQEMSEAYLIQAVMISQYMDYAKTDPKLKPQIAAAVKQGAKASGLDLDLMVLTDEGFKPRKGSDASDVVPLAPGAEEKALAANNTESTDTTTYALIAAAGAGTLAAVFGLGKIMGRRG